MKISISADLLLDSVDKLNIKKIGFKAWAEGLYLKDLVALITTCNTRYHNEGTSQLTDFQYDLLTKELESRKPNHPLLNQVGASPVRAKAVLPYPLFSLDKIKPNEPSFYRWVNTHPGPYVVSDKEDGLSIEIIYKGGIPIAAYTRGNKIVGQDVTYLIPDLKVPMQIAYTNQLAVRMEAVMSESDFNKFSKEEGGKYDNARNLVAGVVAKVKSRHEAIDHIHHIAYEVIHPRAKPSDSLQLLKQLGFKVVPHKIYDIISADQLTKLLDSRRIKSKIGIDGLVIEQNRKTQRPTEGKPGYIISFKADKEGDTVEVEVLGVEWNESKFSQLKPVVLIKPTRLAGVTVSRATGFNARFIETGYIGNYGAGMKPRPVGKGAIVSIKRSGDVIPDIQEVIKPSKTPDMPDIPYHYSSTGVNIIATHPSDTTKAKILTSFFTTMEIDFIKQSTVKRFMEAGLDTLPKILRATKEDFLKIEGVKDTMATKWVKAIKDKTSKPIPEAVLMKASGVFDIGIGETKIQVILDTYPNIVSLYKLSPSMDWEPGLKKLKGFSDKTARVFITGLPKYIKWLDSTKLKPGNLPILVTKSNKLKGQVIVFTKFRSEELKQEIITNSGIVSDSINKDTTILLVPSLSDISSKVAKAKERGVRILTPDKFRKEFL